MLKWRRLARVACVVEFKTVPELTPQQDAWAIPDSQFDDIPDVEPFQLNRDMFDKTVLNPLRKRAAGTLHDKYEIYYHIHRFGGGTALFTCFNAILTGRVSPRFADLFITLRAVILYKDAGANVFGPSASVSLCVASFSAALPSKNVAPGPSGSPASYRSARPSARWRSQRRKRRRKRQAPRHQLQRRRD